MKFAPICACLALVVVGLCDARPEQMVGAPIGMSPEEAERVQLMGERKLNEVSLVEPASSRPGMLPVKTKSGRQCSTGKHPGQTQIVAGAAQKTNLGLER